MLDTIYIMRINLLNSAFIHEILANYEQYVSNDNINIYMSGSIFQYTTALNNILCFYFLQTGATNVLKFENKLLIIKVI